MSAQLDQIADEFRAVSDRARALVERLGEARLTERPVTGGWSVAECLEHLNMTTRAFLPRWHQALAGAPKEQGPYKTDFWGKLLVWTLEPPPKFRMPTTPAFQRIETPPNDQVLPAFLKCQDDLLAVVAAGRGLALDRVKIRSPFQERMQYSVWSSFCVNASHERRHLWQAERVVP
jgi:DinB superfamily